VRPGALERSRERFASLEPDDADAEKALTIDVSLCGARP
jgi:hypothetical protein